MHTQYCEGTGVRREGPRARPAPSRFSGQLFSRYPLSENHARARELCAPSLLSSRGDPRVRRQKTPLRARMLRACEGRGRGGTRPPAGLGGWRCGNHRSRMLAEGQATLTGALGTALGSGARGGMRTYFWKDLPAASPPSGGSAERTRRPGKTTCPWTRALTCRCVMFLSMAMGDVTQFWDTYL